MIRYVVCCDGRACRRRAEVNEPDRHSNYTPLPRGWSADMINDRHWCPACTKKREVRRG